MTGNEPYLRHDAAKEGHGDSPPVIVDEPAQQVGGSQDPQTGGSQCDPVGHYAVLVEVAADDRH